MTYFTENNGAMSSCSLTRREGSTEMTTRMRPTASLGLTYVGPPARTASALASRSITTSLNHSRGSKARRRRAWRSRDRTTTQRTGVQRAIFGAMRCRLGPVPVAGDGRRPALPAHRGNRRSVQVERPITCPRRLVPCKRRGKHRTPRQGAHLGGETRSNRGGGDWDTGSTIDPP